MPQGGLAIRSDLLPTIWGLYNSVAFIWASYKGECTLELHGFDWKAIYEAIVTLSHDNRKVSFIGFSNRITLIYSRPCRDSIHPFLHPSSVHLFVYSPPIQLTICLPKGICWAPAGCRWLGPTMAWIYIFAFVLSTRKLLRIQTPSQRWRITPMSSMATNAHHWTPVLLAGRERRPEGR